MEHNKAIAGAVNGYLYQATVSAERPATDYTPRLISYHSEAKVPSELPHILWQR